MKNKEYYDLNKLEVFQSADIVSIYYGDDLIVTIRKCNYNYEKIFKWLEEEYKEPIKLTDDEKVILKVIDKKYKWIVRSHSNTLFVCENKPTKRYPNWLSNVGEANELDVFNHLFQFIKSEDEESYNIEELLKDENR